MNARLCDYRWVGNKACTFQTEPKTFNRLKSTATTMLTMNDRTGAGLRSPKTSRQSAAAAAQNASRPMRDGDRGHDRGHRSPPPRTTTPPRLGRAEPSAIKAALAAAVTAEVVGAVISDRISNTDDDLPGRQLRPASHVNPLRLARANGAAAQTAAIQLHALTYTTAQINHTRPSPRKHSPDVATRARKQTSDYSLLNVPTSKG